MKGKTVRDAFFTRDEEDDTKWICKCGKVRKVKRSGYNNLVTHVQSWHPKAYAELIRTDGSTELSVTGPRSDRDSIGKNLFFSSKVVRIHELTDFVGSGLIPSSIINNKYIMRHVRYESFNVKTLMKYIAILNEHLEK